jgi:hypothetical protein
MGDLGGAVITAGRCRERGDREEASECRKKWPTGEHVDHNAGSTGEG